MRYFEGYRCSLCGREIPAGSIAGECPACAGPLLAVYDLGGIRRSLGREAFFSGGGGVWRFRALLPPFRREITLGEGNTPAVHAGRLGAEIGSSGLFIKDESLNPTGSFKARGMAVAVSRLADLGVKTAYIPSAGNAGLALAAYGSSAGVGVQIYVPDDTPRQVVKECRAYGAQIEIVEGSIADAAHRMDEEAAVDRVGIVATFREPCRVEGKKTIAFEIEGDLEGGSPDWIIFPTGGGTGIVAIWKAYGELEGLGWLRARKKPRLAVVQSSGCAPLVRAFEDGTDTADRWEGPETIATGIRVPATRADRLILAALRESDGAAVAVDDDEIIDAVGEVAALTGIFPSPEGAATWAGLKELVRIGRIDPASQIVLVNTAGGARYPFLYDRF
jgi:threonine synthase